MLSTIDNLALVKEMLDRVLTTGEVRPLLEGLADDVAFTVTAPDAKPRDATGKAAVREYFQTVGDLVTFWRVKYSRNGERVAVLAEESFTIEPGGLEAESHVALLFELRNGLIVRLLVVESPAVSAGAGTEMARYPKVNAFSEGGHRGMLNIVD
jgi:ketosteroid isomerase-like protein